MFAHAALAAEVRFPSAKLEASDPDETISAQLHRPSGPGPHPAVVLLHPCGGLTQHVTSDWPQFLTGLGYVVLTVDTLGPRGYHQGCGAMGNNRNEVQARDAYGALEYLAKQNFVDTKRIAAVGFSMGALTINNVILLRPASPAGKAEFKAFASFYGACLRAGMRSGAAIREVPLLQVVAELDKRPARSCIDAARTVKMEMHILPGAYHAFDQPQMTTTSSDRTGNTMLYDAAATEKSRALLRSFLERHLKPE